MFPLFSTVTVPAVEALLATRMPKALAWLMIVPVFVIVFDAPAAPVMAIPSFSVPVTIDEFRYVKFTGALYGGGHAFKARNRCRNSK